MLSRENYLTYYRPQLTGLILSPIDEKKLYLNEKLWYKENNIDVKLNTNVVSINPEKHSVSLENKEVLSYDKLILANGSDSFIPPIIGNDKKGCFKLRDLKDLKEIRAYIKDNNCKTAAILGGGLLGLEALDELSSHGIKTTIIERNERILNKQLDIEGSKILENSMKNLNINIVKKTNLVEIIGHNKVEKIKFSNDSTLDVDLLLFSVGIRSNTSIALNTNSKVNSVLLVNELMETNIKDIYACGDIAEINGTVYDNWASSEKMGNSAGANALGDNIVFKNFVQSTLLKAFNTTVFSCGNINEDNFDKTIILKTKSEKDYGRLFFKNDKLVGAILLGDTSISAKLIKYIEEGKSFKDIINGL
ncbi:NAD(P)/FAD-dependent oxidoreductase [Haloimpatiens sp. FM7315]|uniref:NAD(P)/FAD-dependent oxidoreductase n=1 Tax=Haloimpatiens sp. FM7315 TaxID=3298609 RepID=UPI00370A3FF3